MAFDGLVAKSIINELNMLIGGKIDKIFEPDKNTILLGIYSQKKHFNLNICIDSHNYRINLTSHSRPNPSVAPNFCMLLRKHLIGGKISDIYMKNLDRIINIDVQTVNEFNEFEFKTLTIELMGKHSNIILKNSKNIIIDSIRRISSQNSYREILPSRSYILPTSNKIDFELTSFNDFYLKHSSIQLEHLAQNIADTYTGFSLSFINSAILKCNISNTSENELKHLYEYIFKIINGVTYLNFEIIHKKNKITDYVLIIDNSNHLLNSFIDDFYFEKETNEIFSTYKDNILRNVNSKQKKYQNRLESINSKLEDCNKMDKYKLYGELITANLYHLSNIHSTNIELENYYDNNKLITIPLDIKYSPSTNAKRYFKKYSKLKNAFEIVSQQKIQTELEISYMESIIYELESCITLADLQNINEELNSSNIFKKHSTKKVMKNNKCTSFSPIEYDVDGFKVYAGKNNRENDWLTFTFANKKDIWFHTKDIPGSHVILKADKPINDEILVKCARIAAKHSKAKNSSNVPVDFCYRQFVKKIHGSKPGMVIFTNNKTINVKPLE